MPRAGATKPGKAERARPSASPKNARRGAGERTRRAVAKIDWERAEHALDERGLARLGKLLDARSCAALRRAFTDEARFRSTIVMGPKRYGEGTYRYFAYPLPPVVAALREALYPPLARIANRWAEELGGTPPFEPTLGDFLRRCHAEGQGRPTPLVLHYEAGGYNRLHQDVYGRIAFPLQVVVMLSRPGVDFEGGEFLLTERRARMQSRGQAAVLGQGEALVFPNGVRPIRSSGSGGSSERVSRAESRHGVSDVLSGERVTLGLIFHDAA